MPFGFVSESKLNDAKTRINKLTESVEMLEEKAQQVVELEEQVSGLKEKEDFRRKKIMESFMFTGDVRKDVFGNEAQDKSDLTRVDYWDLQKQCYDAFKIFPYANRVIEMITDFVLGTELTFSVDEDYSEKLTPVLESFWDDYDNNFNLMLEGMFNELWVLGEQIYPPKADEVTNVVKLGVVDPRGVKKIVRDKKNSKRMAQIIMEGDGYGKEDVYGVIGEVGGRLDVPDRNRQVKTGQKYVADVFLFQINRLPTQTRGYSELTTMLEYLDLLDQFVFQMTERSLLMFHFIADIMFKNMSQEDIDDYKVPDPKKNDVFKHNQNVEMEMHSPDLRAPDAEVIVRIITRFILAGVGIPEHWVVVGENANLATAKEMNTPIEKRLERKQGTARYILKTMIRYQYEQKFSNASSEEIRKMLKATHLDFPSIAGIDRKMRAEIMYETSKALVVGVNKNWISNEDASNEFTKLANKFGMELTSLKFDSDKQDEFEELTGKPDIANGKELDAYFKALDKVMKGQDETMQGQTGLSGMPTT